MKKKDAIVGNTGYVPTASTMNQSVRDLNQQKDDDLFYEDDEIQYNEELETIINSYIFDDEVAR